MSDYEYYEYRPCAQYHTWKAVSANSSPIQPPADDERCECGAITYGEAIARFRRENADRPSASID